MIDQAPHQLRTGHQTLPDSDPVRLIPGQHDTRSPVAATNLPRSQRPTDMLDGDSGLHEVAEEGGALPIKSMSTSRTKACKNHGPRRPLIGVRGLVCGVTQAHSCKEVVVNREAARTPAPPGQHVERIQLSL